MTVVPTIDKACFSIAVASMIHQNIDRVLGEVHDLKGYRQRERGRGVKLGEVLPKEPATCAEGLDPEVP